MGWGGGGGEGVVFLTPPKIICLWERGVGEMHVGEGVGLPKNEMQ